MRRSLSLALVLISAEVIAAPQTVPSAYRVVAAEYGVPQRILFAIALAESRTDRGAGRPLPWPWALNVRGQSRWYGSKTEALADLEQLVGAGERPDVGLMQVNWGYHATLLGDPQRALDPWANLRAGAAVLAAEYRSTADWWQAVERYHAGDHKRAGDPERTRRAERYRERVRGWVRRLR